MVSNKQIARIFRRAMTFLWDGVDIQSLQYTSEYICYAIAWGRREPDQAEYKARKIITQRLNGYSSVGSWLHWYHDIPSSELTAQKLQAHRRAWLEMLIKEFETK